LLGAEQVFVLDSPGYMLVAIAVVLVAFFSFRLYDFLLSRSRNITETIDSYTDRTLGSVFGQLYKLLDAWAVAAFTIIGVSVTIEMQSSPLWLWGPAMGVITASGGVVLRDIVRADFNITILKQDSYAEISLIGGVLYTLVLLHFPVYSNLDSIFYLTMVTLLLLFGFRFFVLYKGYDNPFQFGAAHTNPQRRLQAFSDYEPGLWKILAGYYDEDKQGNAVPVPSEKLEHVHNQFLYEQAKLRYILDQLVAEPLSDQNVKRFKDCTARLNIVSSIEDNLFTYFQLPLGITIELSDAAGELMQRLHESLKTNLDIACDTISSGQPMDYELFEMIVSKHQERFDALRKRYNETYRKAEDATLYAVLQTTYKAERIIYLLGEYVKIQLGKKELTGYLSNRKAQQAYITLNS
jgi:polar amino acid transport system substrate-binding protein